MIHRDVEDEQKSQRLLIFRNLNLLNFEEHFSSAYHILYLLYKRRQDFKFAYMISNCII